MSPVRPGNSLKRTTNAAEMRSSDGARTAERRVRARRYADLIKDPVAVVTSIYASFGWTVSPAFKAAMVDYLAKNAEKRGKNKRLAKFHRYSLEEYGLDAGEVDARFSRYATAHL